MPPVSLPIASEFLRHRKLFSRLDQLFLSVAPLGHVTDDIGETDQITVVVTHRGERAGHEKRRTVLPDAPPLHIMLTIFDG